MYECISKFNKSLRMMYKLQHSLSKKKKKKLQHMVMPHIIKILQEKRHGTDLKDA